jgi:protoporphyrinogen/coproporphyrinogen III oxidase
MARVVIVGGGLSGLTSAWALSRARHSVCVAEADEAYGGQISTERTAGYVIEHGAEGFVARSEAVPRLAEQVGIENELIGQSILRSLGVRGGNLTELAPGEAATLLGFQVPREELGNGIRSFSRGMGSLIEALRRALAAHADFRPGFRVDTLTRLERGYRLKTQDGAQLDADRVVIATSARAASRLLTPVCGPAAAPLRAASVVSSVTVSLAYDRAAIEHPLDASGFVVATDDQVHGLRACTFVSSKFESRAPAGKACLRVFFRPDDSEIHVLSDAKYGARAHAYLEPLLGIRAQPERSWVSRWPDALPVFDASHKEAVAQLTTALSGSGIALAGAAFHGSGIDAAVQSALSLPDRL